MANYTPTTAAAEPVLVQSAKPHRTTSERFSVSVYADLVKVARPKSEAPVKRPQLGKGRQRVTAFTPKSRKQLLERLAQLRNVQGGYFVTLTYGGRFAWEMSDVKRHLDTFFKAFLRRWPGAGYFWRMERKPRLSGDSAGELVPHFHLLVFSVNPPSLAYLRAWIKRAWSRIAWYPDSEPKPLRVQCDAITNRAHAARYASKYAAKADLPSDDSDVTEFEPGLENCYTGRHWGYGGDLDMDSAAVFEVAQSQLIQFKRLVRAWLKSRGRSYSKRLARIREDFGFSCFGLGDLSLRESGDVFGSTVMRMILATGD